MAQGDSTRLEDPFYYELPCTHWPMWSWTILWWQFCELFCQLVGWFFWLSCCPMGTPEFPTLLSTKERPLPHGPPCTLLRNSIHPAFAPCLLFRFVGRQTWGGSCKVAFYISCCHSNWHISCPQTDQNTSVYALCSSSQSGDLECVKYIIITQNNIKQQLTYKVVDWKLLHLHGRPEPECRTRSINFTAKSTGYAIHSYLLRSSQKVYTLAFPWLVVLR